MAHQNRREFLGRTAVLAGLAGSQPARAGQSASGKRPNLVFLFADQLRYFSCGYAGDEFARTPNIDRLASQGCNFHQAVSSTPVCAPYRASLFTGKYQSSTGMVINELRLSPEHECIGHVLTRNHYRTAYIGKWHLWANELGHHDLTRNGFVPPGPYRLGFDGLWQAYNFNHEYFNSPYFENDTKRHNRKQYEPDGQTDTAIRFLEEAARGDQPFALFVSWGPPHDPWDQKNVRPDDLDSFRNVTLPKRPNYSETSDPYADNWARLTPEYPNQIDDFQRTYYAQSAGIDRCVGRVMDALEKQGLADNTILVFTSDHGEMFGAHGRRAKYIFYEEAARIPYLMRWPKNIPAKSVSETLLGTPDIMPTLLALMNLPIQKSVEGLDLSHEALGRSGTLPAAAYMQGMGTTAAWADGTEWRALRDHEYTYAIYHRDGRELLFRNRTDPYQMRDLASDKSSVAILNHYREMLNKWRTEQNDTFETCTWYRDRWTRDRNITSTARGTGQNLDALHATMKHWYPNG